MFMKKWWLEHIFQDEEGRNVEFRGWINTIAERKEDFPDTISGTFWASKDPETNGYYNGEVAMNGHFDIDGSTNKDDQFVFGSVYPIYLVEGLNLDGNFRAGAERIIEAQKPVEQYHRFEARIEDCLKLDGTYIIEY